MVCTHKIIQKVTLRGHTLGGTEHQKKITKKDKVITYRIHNPTLSLKQIASDTDVDYPYVRKIWSKYQRKLVTNKASAFTPFSIQEFGFYCEGPTRWYRDCPLEASANRNGQKVFRGNYFSIVIHKKGSIFLYDYHVDWKRYLREWLLTWMIPAEVKLFFDYLVEEPRKHIAFNTPGVPTNFKVTIKGVGTFTADKTPFPKGTMEYEFDPKFIQRIDKISKATDNNSKLIEQFINVQKMVSNNMEKFGQGMEDFGTGMKEHMKLIKSVEGLVTSINDVVLEMQKQREQGIIYRVTNWFRSLFK